MIFIVILCFQVASAGANTCANVAGVQVLECLGGGSPKPGRGEGGAPPSNVILVDPCTEYTYTAPDPQRYEYTSSLPFDITITGNTLTGDDTITIGNFICDGGDGTEKCHKYRVNKDATPNFLLRKEKNLVFSMRGSGSGSLTFKIDNGRCGGGGGGGGCDPPCVQPLSCNPASNQCECLPPATLISGNCISRYTAYDEPLTWAEAKDRCEILKGKLAMFKSKAEASAFGTFVRNNLLPIVFKWVGITDKGGKNYEFIDGTSVNDLFGILARAYVSEDKNLFWTDSYESPPPTDSRNCMTAFTGKSGAAIDDRDCSDKRGFICQNVPE